MPYNEKDLIKNSQGDKGDIDIGYILEETNLRKFLYFLDTLAISVCFLLFSLGGAAFINGFLCRNLDVNKPKLRIFEECLRESLLILLLIYFLVFYIPKIPSIVPFPNSEHIKFRMLCRHAVVGASIVFAHQRLFNKFQYFLGIDDTPQEEI